MGARGPVKQALAFKVVAGTQRKSDEVFEGKVINFDPLAQFPAPPPHLNADGAELWKTLGPQLIKAGVLQVVDLTALEQLCHTWQHWRAKARGGLEITASENNALKALFVEFGLTPSARRRVAQAADGPAKGNRFARFSNRDKSAAD